MLSIIKKEKVGVAGLQPNTYLHDYIEVQSVDIIELVNNTVIIIAAIAAPIINPVLKDLSLINISSNKFRGNIIQESIPTKTPINITGKLLIESYSITSVCSMSVTGKEA
jgi:hypothetical protein